MAGDYSRFSSMAFIIVRDPVAAQVIAVDAVLTAVRRPLAPDGPPGIHRAKRKLARHAMSYLRKRRLLSLLPWTEERPSGVELTSSAERVWGAVGALRPRQQVAVVLARFEGSTLAEIADVLDCSISAANSHLERASKVLDADLGPEIDLKPVLTRELRNIAQAFVRDHRPDATAAELALKRSNRWRAWGIAIGALGAGVAAAVVTLLRG
jgi:hypothetical protein